MAKRNQPLPRAVVGQYTQTSIKKRIEQFLLENLGKVATTQQMEEVARDPVTGRVPARWHQRISELRTDAGYTIQSPRDTPELKVGEYLLLTAKKRKKAGQRVLCSPETWKAVLRRAEETCEWNEDGSRCELHDGDPDPVGGGKVKLTPDHARPHSMGSNVDATDPSAWRALCGRHQVTKKNYWNSTTGKLNLEAILQSASIKEKKAAYSFLKKYFDKPSS